MDVKQKIESSTLDRLQPLADDWETAPTGLFSELVRALPSLLADAKLLAEARRIGAFAVAEVALRRSARPDYADILRRLHRGDDVEARKLGKGAA